MSTGRVFHKDAGRGDGGSEAAPAARPKLSFSKTGGVPQRERTPPPSTASARGGDGGAPRVFSKDGGDGGASSSAPSRKRSRDDGGSGYPSAAPSREAAGRASQPLQFSRGSDGGGGADALPQPKRSRGGQAGDPEQRGSGSGSGSAGPSRRFTKEGSGGVLSPNERAPVPERMGASSSPAPSLQPGARVFTKGGGAASPAPAPAQPEAASGARVFTKGGGGSSASKKPFATPLGSSSLQDAVGGAARQQGWGGSGGGGGGSSSGANAPSSVRVFAKEEAVPSSSSPPSSSAGGARVFTKGGGGSSASKAFATPLGSSTLQDAVGGAARQQGWGDSSSSGANAPSSSVRVFAKAEAAPSSSSPPPSSVRVFSKPELAPQPNAASSSSSSSSSPTPSSQPGVKVFTKGGESPLGHVPAGGARVFTKGVDGSPASQPFATPLGSSTLQDAVGGAARQQGWGDSANAPSSVRVFAKAEAAPSSSSPPSSVRVIAKEDVPPSYSSSSSSSPTPAPQPGVRVFTKGGGAASPAPAQPEAASGGARVFTKEGNPSPSKPFAAHLGSSALHDALPDAAAGVKFFTKSAEQPSGTPDTSRGGSGKVFTREAPGAAPAHSFPEPLADFVADTRGFGGSTTPPPGANRGASTSPSPSPCPPAAVQWDPEGQSATAEPVAPVVGLSTDIEKAYRRGEDTVLPDKVRPIEVLRKSMQHIRQRRSEGAGYGWVKSQLMGVRQDILVLNEKGVFAWEVYRFCISVALAEEDIEDFSKCLAQLREIGESPDASSVPLGERLEAKALRMVFHCLKGRSNTQQLHAEIAGLAEASHRNHPFIAFAMRAISVLCAENYAALHTLLADAPEAARQLFGAFLPPIRRRIYHALLQAHATLPSAFFQEMLLFNVFPGAASPSDAAMAEEGSSPATGDARQGRGVALPAFLASRGAVVVAGEEGAVVDCRQSLARSRKVDAQNYNPQFEDVVLRSRAEERVNALRK